MVQLKGWPRVEAGNVTFVMQHELWDGNIQDHADQGVVVQVVSDVDGKETILLRFNCFDEERSYVYGPENENVEVGGPMMLESSNEKVSGGKKFRLDPIIDGNPIAWTMKTIKNKLPQMINRAGYPEIADNLDTEEVLMALPEVEAIARELFATKRNVVKHNRGTEIFEAGIIRFGLEMRRLPVGDGGLAIHVLADIGGVPGKSFVEETEMIAFDCFWDGPHYHYGPRNKNHRIYWDRTLIEDPLGWCLEQLNRNKLGAMIERAGYPGIAADLDEDKIEAVLPDMGKKAREMSNLGIELTGHPGLPLEPTPNMVRG